ncbi:MAG: DMT family transporter [Rhodospirillaceae bacterium]|nr:DMT family transporter [Rhodospirillaceae bacterium]
MMGTMVSFAAMAVGGRELADDLSTFQILFWRSLIGLVIITLLLTRFGWAQIKSKNLKVHAFRSVVHFGSQYCWFLAISLITLAEVVALEFTTSIWTALLAMLFLGEGMSRMGVAAITSGFVGMLVIVRPGAIEVGVGALAGLGAGFGYAVALTAIRFLAQRDTPLCILFYMMALQLPMGLVPALDGWIWPARDIWPWVALVGVTGLSAHYCIARAMTLADAATVTTWGFLRLPFVAAIAFVLYGELPELWVALGATLICVGIYLIVRDADAKKA